MKNSKSKTLKLYAWYYEIETCFSNGSHKIAIGMVSSFLKSQLNCFSIISRISVSQQNSTNKNVRVLYTVGAEGLRLPANYSSRRNINSMATKLKLCLMSREARFNMLRMPGPELSSTSWINSGAASHISVRKTRLQMRSSKVMSTGPSATLRLYSTQKLMTPDS